MRVNSSNGYGEDGSESNSPYHDMYWMLKMSVNTLDIKYRISVRVKTNLMNLSKQIILVCIYIYIYSYIKHMG